MWTEKYALDMEGIYMVILKKFYRKFKITDSEIEKIRKCENSIQ